MMKPIRRNSVCSGCGACSRKVSMAVAFVIEAVDGGLLEGAVHAFYLSVGPRGLGLCQALSSDRLPFRRGADEVEGQVPSAGRRSLRRSQRLSPAQSSSPARIKADNARQAHNSRRAQSE